MDPRPASSIGPTTSADGRLPRPPLHAPGPPRPTPGLLALFRFYLVRYARRHFAAVRVSRRGLPPFDLERPVLVVSNHPSWWDPLLFMLAGPVLLPDRVSYGPMDAAQLRRYPFLRRLGVFGVEQSTLAGARTFLTVGRAVLSRPRGALWVTAEGRFTDPRTRPLQLLPGTARLLHGLSGVDVLPLAIEYPFWNERLPEALLRFGPPIPVAEGRCRPAAEWQRLLERELERTQDRLAAEAMTRDPSLFVELLPGRRGPGGFYGLWRRWCEGRASA